MLSIFPIQFLAPIAYAVLRLGVAFILFRLAQTHMRNRAAYVELFSRIPFFPFGTFLIWWVISLELIAGISLALGLFTQIGALIVVIYSIDFLVLYSYIKRPLSPTRQTLILLLCASLSLFITGPGIFAFDLPI